MTNFLKSQITNFIPSFNNINLNYKSLIHFKIPNGFMAIFSFNPKHAKTTTMFIPSSRDFSSSPSNFLIQEPITQTGNVIKLNQISFNKFTTPIPFILPYRFKQYELENKMMWDQLRCIFLWTKNYKLHWTWNHKKFVLAYTIHNQS